MKFYKFKKISGKIFGYGNKVSKIKEINPGRDWGIVLISFIFIVFVTIAFGFYMYEKVNSENFFLDVAHEELFIEMVDRDELKKVIKQNEIKARMFQENISQKPEFVDPSV